MGGSHLGKHGLHRELRCGELEIATERGGGSPEREEEHRAECPSAAGKERGRKTKRGGCGGGVGGEEEQVRGTRRQQTILRWAAPSGGGEVLRFSIRKSVLNCVQCSQTCAGAIVAVVVLVTDLFFFPILGVEAQ